MVAAGRRVPLGRSWAQPVLIGQLLGSQAFQVIVRHCSSRYMHQKASATSRPVSLRHAIRLLFPIGDNASGERRFFERNSPRL